MWRKGRDFTTKEEKEKVRGKGEEPVGRGLVLFIL
jgi:hypothetical protein